ncbi:hypothetical protein A2303_02520 [Candidatus Falkowbacteria bacterium RIFOXYB2_FULL_47_14]|uniref:Uncharacterized protein n=1 Tax=Candidatus Falkowbacteria bacterium RIFOXYA2_FULL_47_19 TaxID=1797994 RepID=A0A1F5SK13_9BACT|nr:MAG: hypothetical protein A2227_06350 [Candidatus Falkowbacteria bacterium RIFOXYA2_FULL_47_19]OGF35928.1 MAG: hypothetical protein A2468_01805 [Candidatus Falkowbacteria bacterium RIFOXYC2_FULL_46_15]OGF43934.1 MAG: hypothetical protein A2303_02520 [Candidatus Falkowbacteria bacterium RIFOXYB2_FULL_47_14]
MENITLTAENVTIEGKEKKILFRRFRGLGTNKRIGEKDVLIINGLLEKLGIPVGRNLIGNAISFSWTEGGIRKTKESVITGFHLALFDDNRRIKFKHDFSVSVYFKDNKEEDCIDYLGCLSRREPYKLADTEYGLMINSWFFSAPFWYQQADSSPRISLIKNQIPDGKYLESYSGREDLVVYSQTGPHPIVSEEKNGDVFVTNMCLGRCRYKKIWRKNYMRLTYLDQPFNWNRSSVERVRVLS